MTNRKFFALVVAMLLVFMFLFAAGCGGSGGGGNTEETKSETETTPEVAEPEKTPAPAPNPSPKTESKDIIPKYLPITHKISHDISNVDTAININALSEDEAGNGWSFTGGVLTLSDDLVYRIYGTGESTTNHIKVKSGVSTAIILNNVSIDVSSIDFSCAFDITSADVELYLQGENFLRSGKNRAGLEVPDGAMVTIRNFESKDKVKNLEDNDEQNVQNGIEDTSNDIGSLSAMATSGGFADAAGIGGPGIEYSPHKGRAGIIVIDSGNVYAYGVLGGAGIGGSDTLDPDGGGLIIIRGGNIIAESECCGAGIGSGYYSSGNPPSTNDDGTKIFIAGGTIIALTGHSSYGDGAGFEEGAGIGGGGKSDSGVIRILDGLQSSITATGGSGAQDIGCGAGGNISDVEYVDAATLERLIEEALSERVL